MAYNVFGRTLNLTQLNSNSIEGRAVRFARSMGFSDMVDQMV